MCKIRLIPMIFVLAVAFAPSPAQSAEDKSGLVDVTIVDGRLAPEKFDYECGEKVRAVVEMANILGEEKNLFDAYSALQAGRGKSLLLGSEFMDVMSLLGKTEPDEKRKALDEYYASHGQYPTALFGETLFSDFQGNDLVVRSTIEGVELNNLSLNEKEVVVYCTNGYVQYLIARDETNAERFLYKEARVVKYGATEGLVVRFQRGRLERAAACVYPVAPSGRVCLGSAETSADAKKVIVDHTFAPETIVGQVAVFNGQEVRFVSLEKPIPYAEFDSCN